MFRKGRALEVAGPSDADDFADRFTFARARQDGTPMFMHIHKNTFSDAVSGFCKTLLALSVFALVLFACAFGLKHLHAQAEASSTPPTTQGVDIIALDQLRAEVADLTQQNLEMRSELALLTGRDGVFAKLVARLQEQRRVNAAHSNAIRQLFSTTGLIGASLPSPDEIDGFDGAGGQPVQVTPVAANRDDAPKRVVVTPESREAPPATGSVKDEN